MSPLLRAKHAAQHIQLARGETILVLSVALMIALAIGFFALLSPGLSQPSVATQAPVFQSTGPPGPGTTQNTLKETSP